MAKPHFTYKTLSDLREDAGRLGIDLPLVDDREEVKRLLAQHVEMESPGGRRWRIGNSLAIHPMEGCDGDLEGRPGELTFRRYHRFGAGGAKLIWFEACAVVPEGRANPRQLWIHPSSVSEIGRLLEECRRAHEREFGTRDGLLSVLQLTHSGRYSFENQRVAYQHPILDAYPFATPSKLPPRSTAWQLADDEYLAALEDKFVEAAGLAREIGFDGVDVKITHGYLLLELMSARSRSGPYGGSMENRSRFALNVLRKIRARVGEDFLLAVRLGVYDGVPYAVDGPRGIPREHKIPYAGGFGVNPQDPFEPDLTEPLQLIDSLRDAGVRLLNVSMGNPYVNPHIGRPYEKPNEGLYDEPEHPLRGVARHFDATARIQAAFPDLAVVGTGYSWLQHFLIHAGAANIKLGRVKLVGAGRSALAYPDFAREALARGELDPLRTCKTLSYCTYLMRQKKHPLGQFPTGCPPFDKAGYGEVIKEARASARGGV